MTRPHGRRPSPSRNTPTRTVVGQCGRVPAAVAARSRRDGARTDRRHRHGQGVATTPRHPPRPVFATATLAGHDAPRRSVSITVVSGRAPASSGRATHATTSVTDDKTCRRTRPWRRNPAGSRISDAGSRRYARGVRTASPYAATIGTMRTDSAVSTSRPRSSHGGPAAAHTTVAGTVAGHHTIDRQRARHYVGRCSKQHPVTRPASRAISRTRRGIRPHLGLSSHRQRCRS